jgi:hypothetical protein
MHAWAAWKLAGEVFPEARGQRCVVHRNAFAHVPRAKMAEIAPTLKAIHASEIRAAADATASACGLASTRCSSPSLAHGSPPPLARPCYHAIPSAHRHRIRTNNPLERLLLASHARGWRVSRRRKLSNGGCSPANRLGPGRYQRSSRRPQWLASFRYTPPHRHYVPGTVQGVAPAFGLLSATLVPHWRRAV